MAGLKPLDASEGALRAHWNALTRQYAKLKDHGFDAPGIDANFVGGGATAIFRSPALRHIERQRGSALAVPLGRSSPQGFPYWVAFMEDWETLAANSFRFRSSNLTFIQEVPGENFIQLFRAEWPGIRNWGFGGLSFQAAGAAHPHWQFDALADFVSEERRRDEAARLAQLFAGEHVLEEFGEEDTQAIQNLTFANQVDLAWTRMHYACQARWSDQPWLEPGGDPATHASGPAALPNIRNWLVSVLAYSLDQLA